MRYYDLSPAKMYDKNLFNEDFVRAIGQNLLQARGRTGLNATAFTSTMQYADLTDEQVYSMERGEYLPEPRVLLEYASHVGLSYRTLVLNTEYVHQVQYMCVCLDDTGFTPIHEYHRTRMLGDSQRYEGWAIIHADRLWQAVLSAVSVHVNILDYLDRLPEEDKRSLLVGTFIKDDRTGQIGVVLVVGNMTAYCKEYGAGEERDMWVDVRFIKPVDMKRLVEQVKIKKP